LGWVGLGWVTQNGPTDNSVRYTNRPLWASKEVHETSRNLSSASNANPAAAADAPRQNDANHGAVMTLAARFCQSSAKIKSPFSLRAIVYRKRSVLWQKNIYFRPARTAHYVLANGNIIVSPQKTTQSLKTEPVIKREIGCILCKVNICENGQS